MPLRIISGTAGGLRLKTPKRHALRPTQDRIRQVIFSSLAELVPGARVLDLYAGTGSLGLEALSRGAASATFVEQEAEAVGCIRENLLHCHFAGDVRKADVLTYLDETPSAPFDLIFADPPYLKSRGPLEDDPLLGKIVPYLSERGLFIWEHFAGRTLQNAHDWEIVRHRTYGETGLTFLRYLRKK
jgi:16S rRNA (guanine966-N2)-methyltransferase